MTDGNALLAAILAYPDEDTPRLMYADWLQENDQPDRAEFIRVQIELARMGVAPWTGDIAALDQQVRLLIEREDAIFYNLENHLGATPPNWNVYRALPEKTTERSAFGDYPRPSLFFDRGFAHSVLAPVTDWLTHGNAILREHPVRRVRLTTWPEYVVMWVIAHEVGMDWRPGDARDRWVRVLAAKWPGIKFELPV